MSSGYTIPQCYPIEQVRTPHRSGNGKPPTREYVVTVQVEQFVTVLATSPERAAEKVRRDMHGRTGRGTVTVTSVEATDAD